MFSLSVCVCVCVQERWHPGRQVSGEDASPQARQLTKQPSVLWVSHCINHVAVHACVPIANCGICLMTRLPAHMIIIEFESVVGLKRIAIHWAQQLLACLLVVLS